MIWLDRSYRCSYGIHMTTNEAQTLRPTEDPDLYIYGEFAIRQTYRQVGFQSIASGVVVTTPAGVALQPHTSFATAINCIDAGYCD